MGGQSKGQSRRKYKTIKMTQILPKIPVHLYSAPRRHIWSSPPTTPTTPRQYASSPKCGTLTFTRWNTSLHPIDIPALPPIVPRNHHRIPPQNGDLCVSILHPPVDDPQSGELPCERWNPTQNVRTILLSVVGARCSHIYCPRLQRYVLLGGWKSSKSL